MLSRYAIILLDEAHECLLSNQSILDLLKKILPQRPDLKLVVMSPTLETSHFRYLLTVKVICRSSSMMLRCVRFRVVLLPRNPSSK